MEPSHDTPEVRRRVAKNLLILSPFLFVGSYWLAAVQDGERWVCFLVAGVAATGCLLTALVYRLMGSEAGKHLWWIRILLALLARR